jgi:hypothetical protein
MTVTLSPHAERLIREQLAHGAARSPEEVIERALESVAQSSTLSVSQSRRPTQTPAEAVADILELQKRNALGGLKVIDLVQEGRKY